MPGTCIVKLITVVIYGFRNKLEYLSLASLSSLVQCVGTNTSLLWEPLITAVICFMIHAPGHQSQREQLLLALVTPTASGVQARMSTAALDQLLSRYRWWVMKTENKDLNLFIFSTSQKEAIFAALHSDINSLKSSLLIDT